MANCEGINISRQHVQDYRVALAHHLNCFRINSFGDNPVVVIEILDHLLKCTSFDFLPFQVIQRFSEIEENTALADLLDEEVLALRVVGF